MKGQVGGDFTGMLLILILLMVVAGVGGLVAWKMNLFGLGGDSDDDDGDSDDDDGEDNNQQSNGPPPAVVITKSSEITQPTGECSADDVDGDPCTLKNFNGEPNFSNETLTALLKTPEDDGSCDTGYVKVNPTTFLYSSTDPDPQNAVCRKACRCLFSKPDVAPSYKCTQDVEFYKQDINDSRENLNNEITDYRTPPADHAAGWKTPTIFDALKYSSNINDLSTLVKTISCPFPADGTNNPKQAIKNRYNSSNKPPDPPTDTPADNDYYENGLLIGKPVDKYSMKYENITEWSPYVDVTKYYPTQVYSCTGGSSNTNSSEYVPDCKQIIQYKPIKVCKPTIKPKNTDDSSRFKTPRAYVGGFESTTTGEDTGTIGDGNGDGLYAYRGSGSPQDLQQCGSAFGEPGKENPPANYSPEFWRDMATLATTDTDTGWRNRGDGDSTLQPYQKGGGVEMIWFAQNIDGTGYPMACVQTHGGKPSQLCDAPKPLVGNEQADVYDNNAQSYSCKIAGYSGPKVLRRSDCTSDFTEHTSATLIGGTWYYE